MEAYSKFVEINAWVFDITSVISGCLFRKKCKQIKYQGEKNDTEENKKRKNQPNIQLLTKCPVNN